MLNTRSSLGRAHQCCTHCRLRSLSPVPFSLSFLHLVCVFVWVCVCLRVRRPKVNTSSLSSLASFHVSLGTRSSPIWLDWLARSPETSSCLCLASSRIMGVHGHPYFLFAFLFNTWVLGICTEVLMLSWQVLYPQSF